MRKRICVGDVVGDWCHQVFVFRFVRFSLFVREPSSWLLREIPGTSIESSSMLSSFLCSERCHNGIVQVREGVLMVAV